MPTVNSNVKLITSNQAPTTSNLAKGEMAFGQVGGVNSIYGNTGNGIIKIEFTASSEPIIYFANEEALNSFVEGDDVPASGWYAAIAEDSGDEPEPTESYVQFDLSTELPLGNYINSVSFSNRQQVGDYPLNNGWYIDLASGGSKNINISAGASAHSQHLRITVDAWVDKFGAPGYAIPDMSVNIAYYASTNTHAISGVYDQARRRISWNGSFEITDTGEAPATARDVITNLWVAIMRYYDTDSPTLRGTIKFEAIDG